MNSKGIYFCCCWGLTHFGCQGAYPHPNQNTVSVCSAGEGGGRGGEGKKDVTE